MTPASAVEAAKCKWQGQVTPLLSLPLVTTPLTFLINMCYISLKIWSHGENARRNTSKYYGYLGMSEREDYGQ